MRRDETHTGDPRWLVPLVCALPIAAAIAVAVERIGTPTASWAVPLGLATALPWLAAALGFFCPRRAAAVFLLGATAVLVWYPTYQDAAPFQLIALVAVTVILGSTREGVAVWAASVAVMAGAELAGRFEGSTLWILGISLGTRRLCVEGTGARAGLPGWRRRPPRNVIGSPASCTTWSRTPWP